MPGVSIIIDEATPAVTALDELIRGRRIATSYVQAATILVRKNFASLNVERVNKLGGESSGFYGYAAKGTSCTFHETGGVITVSKEGIRQRYFGGTIEPKNGKFLAIPIRSEAYGHTPLDNTFRDTLRAIFGTTGGVLVQKTTGTISIPDRRKGHKKGDRRDVENHNLEQGLAFFALVRSVHQNADPTVLPSDDELHDAGSRAVENLLSRIIRGNNSSSDDSSNE